MMTYKEALLKIREQGQYYGCDCGKIVEEVLGMKQCVLCGEKVEEFITTKGEMVICVPCSDEIYQMLKAVHEKVG